MMANGAFDKSSATFFVDYIDLGVDLRTAALNGSLERLDNKACIQAYAQDFIFDRGTVVHISPTFIESDSLASARELIRAPCQGPLCSYQISSLVDNVDEWRPSSEDVAHCLSQRMPSRCKLQLSLHLIIIVKVVNLIKVVVMVAVLTAGKEKPLMTVGDAIASFVTRVDVATRDCCLYSAREFRDL